MMQDIVNGSAAAYGFIFLSCKGVLFLEFIGNTWAEVDLTALKHNFHMVREGFAKQRQIFSIVKTDAYGHGGVPAAKALQEAGSDGFSVSSVVEALELRRGGIEKPILILGYTPAECAGLLAQEDIHQCVFSLDYAQALSAEAQKREIIVKVHLKLDTGMGRVGFDCRTDAVPGLAEAKAVLTLPNLAVVGVYMHFATADGTAPAELDFAQAQADRFQQAVQALAHPFSYIHCCNSAATLCKPAMGNTIRPGIVLYGLSPLESPLPEGFRPVMSLYSTVSQVKTIGLAESVSYGRTFIAKEPRRIATVCAGYGDGVPRLLSGKGHVIIHGQRAPIVGRVCMDHLCVDVTQIDGVQTGDRVTIFGPGLPVEEVAGHAQTIHYEILCGITKRVPRVYKESSRNG